MAHLASLMDLGRSQTTSSYTASQKNSSKRWNPDPLKLDESMYLIVASGHVFNQFWGSGAAWVTYPLASAAPITGDMHFVNVPDNAVVTSIKHETIGSWLDTSEQAEPQKVELSWLDGVQSEADKPLPSSIMLDMYKSLQAIIEKNEFPVVDEIFESMNPQRMPADAIVGLLRYSFTARHRISRWDTFLKAAETELSSRNIDTSTVLRGLHDGNRQQAV